MKKDTYFNYAGVAPLSFGLLFQIARFLGHFYARGPRITLFKYEKYISKLSNAAALLLGCSPKEISYIKNTTEGIIIAAESLPLNSGDEVLVMGSEYPANLIPWLKKKGDGISVKIIYGTNSEDSFINLLNSISPRTKAISVSWVQFYDGYVVDIGRLSQVCQEKNIFLVVDAVQIVGTRVIDLARTKVDILVCGGHKHLMSTMGSGLIYINKESLPVLKNFKVGIRSVSCFTSENFEIKEGAGRFEDGTPNLIGIISLYYRITNLNKKKIASIEKKNIRLLNHYKKRLTDSKIKFINYGNQGNIISVPVAQPGLVMEKLAQNGVHVKALNGTVIRIAFSYLNSVSDIEKFIRLFQLYQR